MVSNNLESFVDVLFSVVIAIFKMVLRFVTSVMNDNEKPIEKKELDKKAPEIKPTERKAPEIKLVERKATDIKLVERKEPELIVDEYDSSNDISDKCDLFNNLMVCDDECSDCSIDENSRKLSCYLKEKQASDKNYITKNIDLLMKMRVDDIFNEPTNKKLAVLKS